MALPDVRKRPGARSMPGARSAFYANPFAIPGGGDDDGGGGGGGGADDGVRFFHNAGELPATPKAQPPQLSADASNKLSVVWRSVQALPLPPPPFRTPAERARRPPPFRSNGTCVLMHTWHGVTRGARPRRRAHYFSRDASRDESTRAHTLGTWGRCPGACTQCKTSTSRVPTLQALAARAAASGALPHVHALPPSMQLSRIPTQQHAHAQELLAEVAHHARLDRRMLALLLAAGVPSLSIKNLWELAHIDAVGWEAHRFDVGPREADDRARRRAERADAVHEVPSYLLEADEDGIWQLSAHAWTRLFRDAVDGRPGGGRLAALSIENDAVEDDHADDAVAAILASLDEGLSVRAAAAKRAKQRFAAAAKVAAAVAEQTKAAREAEESKAGRAQRLTRVAADALRGAGAAMAARRAAADAVADAEELPPRTPEAAPRTFHALRISHFDTVVDKTLRMLTRSSALASHLTVVCLSHLPHITDKCVRSLVRHCTSLRTLGLEHLSITDEAFRDFAERAPTVRELHLKSLPYVQMREAGPMNLLALKNLRALTLNAPWPNAPSAPLRINRSSLTSLRLVSNLSCLVLNVDFVHGPGGNEPEPEPKPTAEERGGHKVAAAAPPRKDGKRPRKRGEDNTADSAVNGLPVFDLRAVQLARLRVLEVHRCENVCFPYEFCLWTSTLEHLTLASNVGNDGNPLVVRLAGLRCLRSLRVVDGSALALADLEVLVPLARGGALRSVVVGCAEAVASDGACERVLGALREALAECHFHVAAEPRSVATGSAFGLVSAEEGGAPTTALCAEAHFARGATRRAAQPQGAAEAACLDAVPV